MNRFAWDAIAMALLLIVVWIFSASMISPWTAIPMGISFIYGMFLQMLRQESA